MHQEQEQEETIMRSLPISTLSSILQQKTGKDIEIGKLRHKLFHIFGEDASPKLKNFSNLVMNKLQHGISVESGGHKIVDVDDLAKKFFEQKKNYDGDEVEKRRGVTKKKHDASIKRNILDCGILLSGCQSDQTSADACPAGNSSSTYGAFSNVIRAIIEESEGVVTNQELVLKARMILKKQGFSQKPSLYCSDNNVNAPFVCWIDD